MNQNGDLNKQGRSRSEKNLLKLIATINNVSNSIRRDSKVVLNKSSEEFQK